MSANLLTESGQIKPRRTRPINSLFVKILGLLLILTTLPIVVTGFVVQSLNENVAREQQKRLEQQAFTLADTIAGRIKDAAETSIAEIYNSALQLAGGYLTITEPERETRLRDLFRSSPRITDVAYATRDGKIRLVVSREQPTPDTPTKEADVNDKVYFVTPLTKQKASSPLSLGASATRNSRLVAGFPVLNKQMTSGVLIVVFDLNQQWDALIKEKLSDNPQLRDALLTYIVNNDNVLLANSGFAAPANPANFAQDGPVLRAIANNASQPTQQFFDKATGVDGIISTVALNPQINSPTGETVQNVGLFVVVEQPGKIAFAAVDAARQAAKDQANSILAATIVAAVIAALISVVAALALIRPIRKLTQGARSVAAGELDTQVRIGSTDELGELADTFNLMAQKLKVANGVAESYLNPKAAEMVRRSFAEESVEALDGNTEEKIMTLFFSDIVSFTTSTEKLGPAGSIARLNAYYEVVSSLLQDNGGKIDKYVADEIVAIFEDGQDHAYQAVKAAVLTLEALDEWNARSGFEPVKIRIGINTGEVIVANIGSRAARRFDRTVIGDAVNTTQRLMASGSHNAVVISEDTYQRIAGRVQVLPLEPLALKGKTQKVAAYQVVGLAENAANRPQSTAIG